MSKTLKQLTREVVQAREALSAAKKEMIRLQDYVGNREKALLNALISLSDARQRSCVPSTISQAKLDQHAAMAKRAYLRDKAIDEGAA